MKVRLKVVRGKPAGFCLRFPIGEYVFGRGPECHVRPNSALVSRQHCLLRVGDAGVCVRDLGSTNGTLVNGQLVRTEQALADGDVLQVGHVVLEVLLLRNDTSLDKTMADAALCPSSDTEEVPVVPVDEPVAV